MSRRPLPLATVALVLATLVGYLAELVGGGMPVCERFGVTAAGLRSGDVLPLLVYPLLHDPDNLLHVGGNVVLLALVASIVEGWMGKPAPGRRVLRGRRPGRAQARLLAPSADPLVGGSGAIFALLAIAAVVSPRTLAFTSVLFATNLVALFHPSPWLVPATHGAGGDPCALAAVAGVLGLVAARRARRPDEASRPPPWILNETSCRSTR